MPPSTPSDIPDTIVHIQKEIYAVESVIKETQKTMTLLSASLRALKSQHQQLITLIKKLRSNRS